MRSTAPIARAAEVDRHEKHSETRLRAVRLSEPPREYWRVRCPSCGESAYGSTRARAVANLRESACLPSEKRWNDEMYRGAD